MPAPSPRLEAFLRLLTDRGMLRGVDRRLRIELALRELGEPADPRALHDLLVPLVARNREEQARFRELFDDFFGVGSAAARRSSTGIAIPPSPAAAGQPRRSRATIAIVVAASVVAIALLWRGPIRHFMHREPVVAKVDSTVAHAATPSSGPVDAARVSRQLDTLEDADMGMPALQIERGWFGAPRGIVDASFGSAAIIGLPMLLAAFGARRRRAIAYAADDTRKRTPPLVYTPKPPKPPLFMSPEFFDAVRVAVRRQRMDGSRVSVERTVQATIAAGGLPTLRYEPASRPPEYLVLIERASVGDHQALLFDAMAQRMRQEGLLYVERYFYERDPRLCRREHGGPTTIDELQRRFHEHRLIIFGDGDGLFDALSEAELAPWTSVFEAWDDRAILTATPVAAWGARERALGESFAMLPATPQGLREIVESFERGAAPDLRSWREGEIDRRWTRRGQVDVRALRASLDPRVWRWVCACAVYPNLHWALTLYLATLPELGGGEMLREQHLLRLVALPWFREGFMPAEVRSELVDELDESTERAVRRALARLLELDPPDATTAAGRWHEAQMFVQAVLANPEDEDVRAALEARVRTLPRALLLRDPAAAHRLREVRHRRLDRLPRAVRTVLYRDGISLFGARPWTRRTAGAATVLAVAVVPSFLWMHQDRPGRIASFSAPGELSLKLGYDFELKAVARDHAGKPLPDPITWVVEDSGIARIRRENGRTLLRGSRAHQTTLRLLAGGRTNNLILSVEANDGAPPYAITRMYPKRLRAGDAGQLAPPRAWTLSCDASVALPSKDGAFHGEAAGSTLIISALNGGRFVEIRRLDVKANPADTLTALTAPINFERTSSRLSSAALATLSVKVARMRAHPDLVLEATIHETDAVATRAPITRQRADALTAFFVKAGVASNRIVVLTTKLDYQAHDKLCANGFVRSHVTFTPASAQAIARTPNDGNRPIRPATTASLPRSAGAKRPRTSTAARDSASASGVSAQAKESIRPQSPVQKDPAQAPPTDSGSSKADQVQQGPYSAPNAPAPRSKLSAAAYAERTRVGGAGDAPETSAAIRARADLRDERLLKPAPADSTGAVDAMPAGTYAFASPNVLIAIVEKGDGASVPGQARRTASADFEIHNVDGVRYIAAFVDQKVASALRSSFYSSSLGQLQLLPTATGAATCPVEIPLSSLRSPKFVTSPAEALFVTIQPRTKDQPYIPLRVSGCPSGVEAK
jgi:hypothetical protein